MTATALPAPRFVRRTRLGPNEYRKNFHQIDAEVISAVTSAAADRVTPLMSKIYLRLTGAPVEFWEGEGVLYFSAKNKDGRPVKASKVLYECLGVASATAHKALAWMHEQGIIGYFSGKNGAGIRIFLNRAAGSIGVRAPSAGKKILPFVQGSNGGASGSSDEPAFNDSYAVLEISDTDINSRAPKNGADNKQVDKILPEPAPTPSNLPPSNVEHNAASARPPDVISLEDVVTRLRAELEPAMHMAARQAAAREHERTREWLENRGLPKAARVAQHEAYNVLRKYGVISETARSARTHADVGRSVYTPPEPHTLTQDEVAELAEACVAMLETKGQSIDLTLSEMSDKAGGFLLPEDAPRVREMAISLLSADASREGK
jgi:hypothetical protein